MMQKSFDMENPFSRLYRWWWDKSNDDFDVCNNDGDDDDDDDYGDGDGDDDDDDDGF